MKPLLTPKKVVVGVAVAALLLVLESTSLLWAQANQKLPAEADKLHVVLMVNGTDKSIGATCLHDVQALKKVLRTAFAKDAKRLVIHDLTLTNPKTKKLYTANEIIGYLKGMQVGKNDNVLVYHSGHGCVYDAKKPEHTHTLFIDGGSVNRMVVEQAVLAKKPRSLIILTDCCSVFRGPRAMAAEGRPATPAMSVNVQTVRNLMLKTAGVVSITAADDGKEASSGHTGPNPSGADGAFTVAFLRLLCKTNATYSNWGQFYPALRSETGKASNGGQYARAFQLPR
jgi:hypothetical protein